MSLRRRSFVVLCLVTVMAGGLVNVPSAAAADPPVPPLRADGPITLPTGRILPAMPPGLQRASVQAEMLAAHADDPVDFTPGARPQSRAGAVAATSLAAGQGSHVTTLGLAPPWSSEATLAASTALPNGMRKEVVGFLPYWMLSGTALQWMQYQLVTTIAYFGVAARSDGTLATSSGGTVTSGWSGWNSSAMTQVTNAAHARGVRVVLTVSMMAWDGGTGQATLLGNATARSRLVAAIAATVKDRAADGVNLDFEPVYTAQRDQYTSFVRQLKAGLVAAGVGSYLTVDTMAGAATWSTGYDVAALTASGAADALFVMGYDYSWSGSARAGGVAPMDSPYMLDVNESVDDYLSLASGNRILWGVPYYGRTWQTTSGNLNALTASGASGASKAYYYTGARDKAAQYGRLWDSVGRVPWFKYWDSTAATWVEGYYDDATSLAIKYDMVNQRGLAGTGMWTLLMDQGDSALWNLIANKFVNDTTPPTGGIRLLAPTTDAAAVQVGWAATDVGSGVSSYSVQVRDRSGSTWTPWLTGTTARQVYFVGSAGHSYEFRVSATDFKGNAQPWLPANPNPGSTLAVGGFARVAVDSLRVRGGAGTGFAILDTLAAGSVVAVLGGPIDASGYRWYQVQFDFSEWPSSQYPRLGWAAAASGSTPYLVPTLAPTATTLTPTVTGYQVTPRRVSPNGDGVGDTVTVSFSLPLPASQARLEVLSATGSVVDSEGLGSLAAGAERATWDGRLGSGAWAGTGSYLLRVTAVDQNGTHVAPAPGVDAAVLAAWGVAVDLVPPTTTATQVGADWSTTIKPSVAFSEPVVGVGAATFSLRDTTAGKPVAGTVTYTATTRTAMLTPSAALLAGHTYAASLTADIRDTAGNRLAKTSWSFTTTPLVTTYSPARSVIFLAGTYTGRKFDSAGNVIASKTYTLTKNSSAPTTQRNAALPKQSGAWFYITAGVWAGYWVRESPSVFLPGIVSREKFSPLRTASFAIGTYTGYRFDSTWRYVVAKKTYSLAKSSSASASSLAVINGRRYVLISNGIWAGYWIPMSSAITLR